MGKRSITTLGLAAFTLAAAGMAPRWTAILNPSGGSQVAGQATLEAVDESTSKATVQITGAKPGAKLGWTIAQGSCGAKGKALGSADFPAISAGPDGKASGSATLPAAPPASGALSATVFDAAASDMAPLACGMFKAEGGAPADSGLRP